MMVGAFGSGLVKLAGYRQNEDSFVGITGKNSVEWVVAMFACAEYNYIYTPLYSTLGNEGLQHILNQTELEVAVCQTSEEAAHLIKDFSSCLRLVIICRQDEAGKNLKSEHTSAIRVLFFEEVLGATLLSGARAGIVTNPPESLLADIAAIRPTVFTSVPRVLNRIRSEFYKKFPKSTNLQKRLQHLIDSKNTEQEKGIFSNSSFVDRIFFKKFRKAMGGRVSLIVSASAAMEPDVIRFFRAALGCPVVQVYGMTELTGGGSATPIGDCSLGSGGALMYEYHVKLKDVPEMGLFVNRNHRGEVCFRGPGCTSGYYRDHENTAKLYDEQGWLRTGDIAQWNEQGGLEIVDRCKSMFKLAQGEYIAPEKVEGVYALSNLVRVILVDGSSNVSFAVAIVWPDFLELRKSVAQMGVKQPATGSLPNITSSLGALSDEELCCNIHVRLFVLNQLNTLARQRKLKGFEMVRAKNVFLTTEVFSPENGLLTPTLKIARFKARAHFQEVVKSLYAEGELIPSGQNAV
ncbi:unnamed protein product [Echinostoma caproni]|uniref:long-chain-fatty-acid--CoA ligase n=1 Tax=Echinostoma caproni TaxID=27848 RepID=A0A183AB70_9TREM|nr:unnamed protein product [Echinostoma caproni]